MPVARPEPHDVRVIAHVDLDCFYVQVEQRKQPELRGKPAAVVQYNPWKGGGLIAVGYEAREFGVKRSMRGEEAKRVCPDIQLIQVPVSRGKADLKLYRDAGSEVVSVLARRGVCERASIDEVYLDITDAAAALLLERPLESLDVIPEEAFKTHVLGIAKDADNRKEMVKQWLCRSCEDHRDHMLACGSIIIAELRMAVLAETQFTCSAGIAHNKMLAKLASGMHKPAQQTIVPSASVPELLASLPVKKMKQLGGKLGNSLETDLGVKTVGDLLQFSESKLQDRYGMNTGTWLWNIARGISGDEVKGRLLPKSQGCGKTFPGPRALRTFASVEHWLGELSAELNERIQADFDQNKRIAHHLTLHARASYQENRTDSKKKFPSKSCPLRYGKDKISQDAIQLFERGLREFCGVSRGGKRDGQTGCSWAVTGLSITASNIFATPSGINPITQFFSHPGHATGSSADLSSYSEDHDHDDETSNLFNFGEGYLEEITGNNLEAGILEVKNINDDIFGNCSHNKVEEMDGTSATRDFNSSTRLEEILNQPKEKCFSDPNSKLLTDPNNGSLLFSFDSENEGLHENSLCEPTEYPQPCREYVEMQKEETRRVDIGSEGSTEASENLIGQSEQQPAVTNLCHSKTVIERKADSLKLEDIWQRCGSSSSSVSKSQHIGANSWYYKPGDIDESVLTELPEEIQQELRSHFRLKRPRMAKHFTIGDYFKSSSNL